MFVLMTLSAAWADDRNDKTVIYVTRHADDQIAQLDLGGGLFQQDCTASACCTEVLNPLGVQRASSLADWFVDQGITAELDEVIATHKPRTADTVRQVAVDAGLDAVDSWVDQVPGDGVHNVPATPPECGDPAYESSSSTYAPTIAHLQALPPGSTVLVAAHSSTVTSIMGGFGIPTTDRTLFPGSSTKITGFNNLWKIEIDRDGHAILADHWVLDFALDAGIHDRFSHGNGCTADPADQHAD